MARNQRWWLLSATAGCALIAGADLAYGGRAPLGMLLILGPLLVCGRLGPRATAVVAGWALALAVALGAAHHALGTVDVALRAAGLAAGGAVAVHSAHRRGREHQALRIAGVAQAALLRPVSAELGGVSVTARYHSAAHHALIGGDLYDIAHTPFGVRVIVGDVRGKGLAAVGLSAATVHAFRDLAYTTPDLLDLTRGLDARLTPELGAEDFVTAVLAEFAPGEVRLVNCGHHPPLRVGRLRLDTLAPATTTPPLGLGPDPVQQRVRLAPTERLLLYTDGLAEARDPAGTMFDPRGEKARLALASASPSDAVRSLFDQVVDHTAGTLDDDLVLVLCQSSAVAVRPVPPPGTPLPGGRRSAPGRPPAGRRG